MENCSKSRKLTPEGKYAFLEQALKLITLKNGNARKFLQLINISKSFTGCVHMFPVYSLGLKCFGNYNYKLFVSGTKAFEENCERVAYFDKLSGRKMHDLIRYLNPRKFVANFFDEFWLQKDADALNLVNVPIDMICNVNSDFVLSYQTTSFWRFNLRRLKFNCDEISGIRFYRTFQFNPIDVVNSIVRKVNHENADKSETLEHIEVCGIFLTDVTFFIDSLKFRFPNLKLLKVKSLNAPFDRQSLDEILGSVNSGLERVQPVKDACINWISHLDLEISFLYKIEVEEDLRNYTRTLQQIGALRNAELKETVDGVEMLESLLKINEQDDFSDTRLQIAVRRQVFRSSPRIDVFLIFFCAVMVPVFELPPLLSILFLMPLFLPHFNRRR